MKQRSQRPALDQLHREIRPPVGKRPELIDRHNPRMLQLAADLCFLDEPPDHLRVALMTLEQHLDRKLSAQVNVPTPEDRSHATPRDLALKLIPAHAPADRIEASRPIAASPAARARRSARAVEREVADRTRD